MDNENFRFFFQDLFDFKIFNLQIDMETWQYILMCMYPMLKE